jgi:hypothetical protein
MQTSGAEDFYSLGLDMNYADENEMKQTTSLHNRCTESVHRGSAGVNRVRSQGKDEIDDRRLYTQITCIARRY